MAGRESRSCRLGMRVHHIAGDWSNFLRDESQRRVVVRLLSEIAGSRLFGRNAVMSDIKVRTRACDARGRRRRWTSERVAR